MEHLPEGEYVIADGLFADLPNFLTPLHDRAHYDYWDKFIGTPNLKFKRNDPLPSVLYSLTI
jgi:hypothetical protein